MLQIDEKLRQCFHKQHQMLQFLREHKHLQLDQEEEDELDKGLVEELVGQMNKAAHGVLMEHGYKLREKYKQLKVRAAKNAEAVDSMHQQFLESLKDSKIVDLLSI